MATKRRHSDKQPGETTAPAAGPEVGAHPSERGLSTALRGPGAGTPRSSRRGRLRILVADDNPTSQRVARLVLESMGHEVHLAADGIEALEALEEDRFQLALLDQHMPNMQGIEVAQVYRAIRPTGGIPLVLLTADASEYTEQSAAAAGIDWFLSKPLRRDRVEAAIERLVQPGRERASGPVGLVATPETRQPNLLNQQVLDDLVDLGGALFLDGLISGFREDSEAELKRAKACAAASDLGALRDALHTLRGGARNVGGRAMDLHLGDMQDLPDAALQESLATLLLELQRLRDATCQALTEYRRDVARH